MALRKDINCILRIAGGNTLISPSQPDGETRKMSRHSSKLRLSLTLVGSGLAAFTLVSAASAGTANASASPSSQRPKAPSLRVVKVSVTPAFDNDLPKGKTTDGPGGVSGKATSAAGITPAASFVCTIYASDPSVEDGTTSKAYVMMGNGLQLCSGAGYANQKITVAIQTYIGLGLWDNRVVVPTAWSSADVVSESAYWDCTGSGTQTYRIVTTGWAASGDYGASVQSENYLRVTCAA